VTEPRKTRAANGRSSVFQSADGTWHGFVTMGVRPDGKPDRRHRKGRTRQEVTDKVAALEAQRDQGQALPAGERTTVATWLTYWLENIAAEKVTEGTLSGYRPLVERHIVPGLGAHLLTHLEPEHVEAFYRKLARQGMAAATRVKVHRILSRALKVAVQRGRVRRNVCTLVNAPKLEPTEAPALTADQARAVLKVALEDRLAALWAFRLEVGCRQGEALGLAWGDLTLPSNGQPGRVVIRRQLRRLPARHGCGKGERKVVELRSRAKVDGVRPTTERDVYPCGQAQPIRCPQHEGGGVVLIPYPKSKRPRHVTLSPSLTALLVAHGERQQVEREAAGTHWAGNGEHGDLVFRQVGGRRIDPRHDYAAWVRLLEEAEVPTGGTHLARHTSATLMLEAGVAARVVMEVLGHSQIAVTMNTYSHVSGSLAADAAERIEGVLWR